MNWVKEKWNIIIEADYRKGLNRLFFVLLLPWSLLFIIDLGINWPYRDINESLGILFGVPLLIYMVGYLLVRYVVPISISVFKWVIDGFKGGKK